MSNLRVLLIDDNPSGLIAKDGQPELRPELRDLIDVHWVQNPVHGRWLLDAYSTLATHASGSLLSLGLPPHILVFDYSLGEQFSKKRVQRQIDSASENVMSVFRNVQGCLDSTGLDFPKFVQSVKQARKKLALEGYSRDLFTYGATHGDHIGMLLGTSFARAFSGYPCGVVPTTAIVTTEGTEIGFYEWLNERYYHHRFAAKSRFPTWEKFLAVGLDSLRHRLLELSAAGQLAVTVRDLHALRVDPADAWNRDLALRFRSPLGVEELRVRALFLDLKDDETAVEAAAISASASSGFETVAAEWASEILKLTLLAGESEFFEARELADSYFETQESRRSLDRYELSRLAATAKNGALAPAESERLAELCQEIEIDPEAARAHPAGVQIETPGWVVPKLKAQASSDLVARLAVLLLMLKLEASYRVPVGDPFDPEREEMRDRVTQDDVFMALDPMPEDLLTFKDKQQGHGTLRNSLKRLGMGGPNGWGHLSLSINDVLVNKRAFDCGECQRAYQTSETPCQERASHAGAHGLRPEELRPLRAYAVELGLDPLPAWLSPK
ncbi:MAG: hypothetical protein GKS06_20640 [Acidobacteria bacterium]|nr:hypothetical protein [Acidobacteriota bacterium]